MLFRGNREADIRKNLIRQGLIKGIIGLPTNLFYGTGIPACILVIDKENAHARTGIFMIDASKGFKKDGNKNRLRAQDIHRIVDVFNKQIKLPRYSRMAPVAEIASPANDYNLNIPRYIDSSEAEDLHDLDAHLNGGIPNRDLDALSDYWNVFPTLRRTLFSDNGRAGYSEARVETLQVKVAILDHDEFNDFERQITTTLNAWQEAHEPRSQDNTGRRQSQGRSFVSCRKTSFRVSPDLPLLDAYNVYQCLMDYWDETMQDDLYLVAADGWIGAAKPRGIVESKEKKLKETPDLIVRRRKYKMDLIPPVLVVGRCFAAERTAMEALQATQEPAAREMEEFIEEHSAEEGLLADALNDKGKVTKGGVTQRLKSIRSDPENEEESEVLTKCLALIEANTKSDKAVKEAQSALDEQVLARYSSLTEAEIKSLVVGDKWFASIDSAIKGEVQRITQQLAGRVREVEERYASPLPELEREVEAYSEKVEGHLKKMGLSL